MWQGYFYYLFGFLFIVAFLMITITAEVSILCTCAPPLSPLSLCVGCLHRDEQSRRQECSLLHPSRK